MYPSRVKATVSSANTFSRSHDVLVLLRPVLPDEIDRRHQVAVLFADALRDAVGVGGRTEREEAHLAGKRLQVVRIRLEPQVQRVADLGIAAERIERLRRRRGRRIDLHDRAVGEHQRRGERRADDVDRLRRLEDDGAASGLGRVARARGDRCGGSAGFGENTRRTVAGRAGASCRPSSSANLR